MFLGEMKSLQFVVFKHKVCRLGELQDNFLSSFELN